MLRGLDSLDFRNAIPHVRERTGVGPLSLRMAPSYIHVSPQC